MGNAQPGGEGRGEGERSTILSENRRRLTRMKLKASSDSTAPAETDPGVAKSVTGAGIFLLIMLPLVAWRNLEMLNPDAVAYLRIASYYANGQTDLAISGYWGPLLSWLLAPLLKLGMEPLIAARSAMAVSAVIFWLGCMAVFRSFPVRPTIHVLGAWLAALAAIGWSVRFITPDLLASGLICFAVSQTIQLRCQQNWISSALTGLFWGLAYLAKAITLPLAFVFTFGVLALEWRVRLSGIKTLVRSLFLALLALALIAIPWVIVLSLKYGAPTFSTTARIAHAVAGPSDVNRRHPFAIQFHRPAPGRITSWEDPSLTPYQYWSPFENRAYLMHQLKLIEKNLFIIASMLTRMNLFAPVMLLVLACALGRRRNRLPIIREPWFVAVVLLVSLPILYLPFFLNQEDQRYFYALFPFMWVASFGVLDWLQFRFPERSVWLKKLRPTLLAFAFASPALLLFVAALVGLPHFAPAGRVAHQLAARLAAAGIRGPIAGSALLRGGRAGLYTAFFLNQPWYGDQANPTPASFKTSNARLIIVRRDDPTSAQLDSDPAIRSLDNRLFDASQEASRFPLKVYELSAR